MVVRSDSRSLRIVQRAAPAANAASDAWRPGLPAATGGNRSTCPLFVGASRMQAWWWASILARRRPGPKRIRGGVAMGLDLWCRRHGNSTQRSSDARSGRQQRGASPLTRTPQTPCAVPSKRSRRRTASMDARRLAGNRSRRGEFDPYGWEFGEVPGVTPIAFEPGKGAPRPRATEARYALPPAGPPHANAPHAPPLPPGRRPPDPQAKRRPRAPVDH